MIWLAWRQFRANAVLATTLVLGVVALLLVTHGQVAGVATVEALSSSVRSVRLLGTLLIGVPALIGAFWGAPLVAREIETGTYRLVWTQGVTQTRWLLTRVAVVMAGAVVATGAFSAVFTWWSVPLDRFGNRIGTANFGQRGIAPIGYAVFAVALGVLLGAVLRRTLPAMFGTLVVFLVARFSFQRWVRPHLLQPVQQSLPTNYFGTRGAHAGGWVLTTRTVGGHGRTLTPSQIDSLVRGSCSLARTRPISALARCADRLGLRDVVTVHPASQFWALQALETLCFVALGAFLVGVALWWVRHRLAH